MRPRLRESTEHAEFAFNQDAPCSAPRGEGFQVFFSSSGGFLSPGGCAPFGGVPNPGIPGNPGKGKPEKMLRVWLCSCSCICRNTLRLCSVYAEIRLCIAGPWKLMNCFHRSSFDLVGSP